AHGPEPAAVSGGLDPSRVGKLAGKSEIAQVIEVRRVGRRIEPLHRGSRRRRERRRPLGRPRESGPERLFLPALARLVEAAALLGGRAGRRHSGMFPWFLGGFWSRLVARISSAWISFRRVSRGSMTSSMYPRSAAEYGLANFSRYSLVRASRS